MARALRTKNCVAYAKIAHFEGGKTNLSLETLVREILKILPDVRMRRRSDLFGDQVTQLSNFELYADGGVAIVIDCHSPDNEASTIRHNPKSEQKSTKQSLKAPKGQSMVKYDVFAYINGNSVVLAGDIVKDYVFETFINQLALDAKIVQSDLKVKVSPATVKDKIKLVNKFGVSQIELNVSAYAHELEQAASKTSVSAPLAVLRDILGRRSAEDTIGASRVNYRLVVDISKLKKTELTRSKDGTLSDPASTWAKRAAEGVLEDYVSDYTIVLRGRGGRIKQSEMRVSKIIKVTPHGKSFDTNDMWYNLSATHKELCKEGVF